MGHFIINIASMLTFIDEYKANSCQKKVASQNLNEWKDWHYLGGWPFSDNITWLESVYSMYTRLSVANQSG